MNYTCIKNYRKLTGQGYIRIDVDQKYYIEKVGENTYGDTMYYNIHIKYISGDILRIPINPKDLKSHFQSIADKRNNIIEQIL